MEPEIWRVHPEYTGIEVSTFGRVRTLDKMVWNGKVTYLKKGRVLKQRDNGNGYLRLGFHVNGKQVTKLVHRLVAQAFLPNHDNLPQVNHKDCNPSNNCVSNLEWCNNSYNQIYRDKFGISNTESRGVPIFAVNLTTLKVSRFRSQHEAGRELGVYQANINNVIRGRYKQTGNFLFVNADDNAVDIINQKLHDVGKTGLKLNA